MNPTRCPFCGRPLKLDDNRRAARHEIPLCERFVDLIKKVASQTYEKHKAWIDSNRGS